MLRTAASGISSMFSTLNARRNPVWALRVPGSFSAFESTSKKHARLPVYETPMRHPLTTLGRPSMNVSLHGYHCPAVHSESSIHHGNPLKQGLYQSSGKPTCLCSRSKGSGSAWEPCSLCQ